MQSFFSISPLQQGDDVVGSLPPPLPLKRRQRATLPPNALSSHLPPIISLIPKGDEICSTTLPTENGKIQQSSPARVSDYVPMAASVSSPIVQKTATTTPTTPKTSKTPKISITEEITTPIKDVSKTDLTLSPYASENDVSFELFLRDFHKIPQHFEFIGQFNHIFASQIVQYSKFNR